VTTAQPAIATHPDTRQRPDRSAHSATGRDRAVVSLLGVLGFALSYSALQQMATAIHVLRPLSYAYPPLVDGFIAYGVRAVLVLRTAPLHARLYAWMLFGAATSASIWANALHALDLNKPGTTQLHLGNPAVVVLSAIPPLALGGATHLHVLISRYGSTTTTPASPVPVSVPRTTTEVLERANEMTGTPAEVLDSSSRAPRSQAAIEAHGTARETAPPAASGTPDTQHPAGNAASSPESADPSSAGQGPQEGSGPRPQPSQGGRPPMATLAELAEAISTAHPDPAQITRESARKAIADVGLGAGHERLNEAIALVRQRAEDRQYLPQD
jgi:Protein of unknown function (DUF2637)